MKSEEYRIEPLGQGWKITVPIPRIDFARYFTDGFEDSYLQEKDFVDLARMAAEKAGEKLLSAEVEQHCLKISTELDEENTGKLADVVMQEIEHYLEEHEVHITRMFGSFVYLKRNKEGLEAVHAAQIPLQYCPLMKKLLIEIGGDTASELLEKVAAGGDSGELMCNLIDDVVIRGRYFDTGRALNSCEVNVLFGASEIMSSALESDLIDAAVIVSNNLGTIITTTAPGTQGAVQRMTGLFATSPSEELQKTAGKEGIISVFPYTARIDQLAGVKKAIEMGYRRIAVSVAWKDNQILPKIRELEKDGVELYIFALCSTGLPDFIAEEMGKHADLVWSCASKAVKDHIEPDSIAQIGAKIPVYIQKPGGWRLAENHLHRLARCQGKTVDFSDISLEKGENRSVVLNGKEGFTVIRKKNLHDCTDCPYPCQ